MSRGSIKTKGGTKADAFLARDWSAFDEPLDEHLRALRAAHGAAAIVALADDLRAQVKAVRPDWPTRADRARDERHHLELIAILDRVPARGR